MHIQAQFIYFYLKREEKLYENKAIKAQKEFTYKTEFQNSI